MANPALFPSASDPTGTQYPTHGIGQPILTTPPVSPAAGSFFGIMKSAIAAAAAGNSVELDPWAIPAPWTASGSYIFGAVVRGAAGDDVNNMYHATVVGTTAATGGPTGRGNLEINDNTAKWMYAGRAKSLGSYPLWSTVVPTNLSSVMNGYLSWVASANFAAMGLTKVVPITLANTVGRIVGGPLALGGSGGVNVLGSNGGTVAAPSRIANGGRWCFHFGTDCERWLMIRGAGGNSSSRPIAIEVNGRLMARYAVNHTQNPLSALVIDLGQFGPGAKDVRIYGGYVMEEQVFDIVTDTYTNLWKPNPRNNLMLSFEGDSITQFGGSEGASMVSSIESNTARLLGIENFYNNAVGATGFLNTFGGTRTTFLQRLPDVVSMNPNIHVFSPSVNDVNASFAPVTRQPAYLAYMRAARAAMPNCTLVATGVHMLATDSLTSTTEPSFLNAELQMKAAFDQFADANSVWVPLLTSPTRFPSSNANDTWGWSSPQAGGTNGHPVFRYYQGASKLIADGIKAFFA